MIISEKKLRKIIQLLVIKESMVAGQSARRTADVVSTATQFDIEQHLEAIKNLAEDIGDSTEIAQEKIIPIIEKLMGKSDKSAKFFFSHFNDKTIKKAKSTFQIIKNRPMWEVASKSIGILGALTGVFMLFAAGPLMLAKVLQNLSTVEGSLRVLRKLKDKPLKTSDLKSYRSKAGFKGLNTTKDFTSGEMLDILAADKLTGGSLVQKLTNDNIIGEEFGQAVYERWGKLKQKGVNLKKLEEVAGLASQPHKDIVLGWMAGGDPTMVTDLIKIAKSAAT